MQVRMPKFVDSHVGSEVHRREKDKKEKKNVVCIRAFLVGNIISFLLVLFLSSPGW